ncbi:MAG TPA: trypsin-like serine protease [Verrucomicrobiales bacterium]|nr:trypsin-like serine protease [Verrucomicrobiales bacterium]HIL68865.1 trypsin-like serine protease [Verrucomicrobiota bacterium]
MTDLSHYSGRWKVHKEWTWTKISAISAIVFNLLFSQQPACAQEISNTDSISPIDLAIKLNQSFINVAEQIFPSVVVVKIRQQPKGLGSRTVEEGTFFNLLPDTVKEFFLDFYRNRNPPPRSDINPEDTGQGSGVVIDSGGFILTNYHVIEKASDIWVQFQDGREYEARIQGVDSSTDLAVIQIDRNDLIPATFGDSDTLRVGEFAIAIGAPFELDYSVTFGHISAKGRMDVVPRKFLEQQNFIQTDANINPGNSGGPLVNIKGEVIGINTLIRGLNTGIGFAIPINLAGKVSRDIISKGHFSRAWLGVIISDYKNQPPPGPDTSHLTTLGARVNRIFPGPTRLSDLEIDDIVIAADDRPVRSANELKQRILMKDIGQKVILNVIRSGALLDVTVRTSRRPDHAVVVKSDLEPEEHRNFQSFNRGWRSEVFGMQLSESSPFYTKDGGKLPLRIYVTDILPGSLADRQDIRKGDWIVEIGVQKVDAMTAISSLDQAKTLLSEADSLSGVILYIQRGSHGLYRILKERGD